MRKVASWIVLAIGLLPWWLIFVWFFGYRGPGQLILVIFLYGLSVALLALVTRRIGPTGWLVAGLLILAGLFVPTAVLTDNLGSLSSLSMTIFQITVFLLPSIGLIMAAVLLYSGLNLLGVEQNSAAGEAGSQATQAHGGKVAGGSRVLRWLVAGLLVLAGLFVQIALLKDNFVNPSGILESIFQSYILMLPMLALIMAAVLVVPGLNKNTAAKNPAAAGSAGLQTNQKSKGRLAAACFVLSGLLLLKTLHNLYWVTLWDNTTDSLGYIWIVVPVLVAFFAGVLLLINLRRWTVWAGLGYLVLVPGLIIAVSTYAQRMDFRQLTEARARQVSQLVEAYYAREGYYPQNLRQAKPWYATSLPGPFIIYGQEWCYQAGQDYYQLGYVYREHWSSPELIRRLYRSGGEPPESEAICADEIEALIRRESFFYEK